MRTNVSISKLLTTQSKIASLKLLLKKAKQLHGLKLFVGSFFPIPEVVITPKTCGEVSSIQV